MQDNEQKFTAEEFLTKLKNALSKDGDFPASARVVNELKGLTANPNTTANQVTESILKEPSLGIRVLHLVNSTFYRRAQPIMTVSQAVMQIGMKPLADLCAGLVLLQKFVPAARHGGAFANCLQKTLLSSLLSSALTTQTSNATANAKSTESGYLAGTFAEIGPLLLAFYFPQIYENALKRSESKKQDLEKSIHELIGLTPNELSKEVLQSLELPEFYIDVINSSEKPVPESKSSPMMSKQAEIQSLSRVVHAAKKISNVLVYSKDKNELDKTLSHLTGKLEFDSKIVSNVLGNLPAMFQSHCDQIDLSMPALPEFINSYNEDTVKSDKTEDKQAEQDQFSQFVNEIRQAVENREPTASVITTVMETLAWGLKFDRVLLLLVGAGKRKLVGRMLLGNVSNFDPTKFERTLGKEADPHAPEAKAFSQGSPVFTGDPLFDDGWPIVALPIGFGGRAIGVIYADRKSQNEELSAREQAAITVLTELLDRSVGMSS